MNSPLKRSRHIVSLSKDHHFTLLFCWKIRQGIKHGADSDRIVKYVQWFWERDMKGHFREEEEVLFSSVKDEKVAKAIDDHRQIERQIEKLSGGISAEEANKQLLLLADMVDNHVRYEERELFPHLEKVLAEEQLAAIGAQLKNEPRSQEEYQDVFWNKT